MVLQKLRSLVTCVLESGYQILVVKLGVLVTDGTNLTELGWQEGGGFGMTKGMETMMILNAPKVIVSWKMDLKLLGILLAPSPNMHKRTM